MQIYRALVLYQEWKLSFPSAGSSGTAIDLLLGLRPYHRDRQADGSTVRTLHFGIYYRSSFTPIGALERPRVHQLATDPQEMSESSRFSHDFRESI
jgi:hypothetical protein